MTDLDHPVVTRLLKAAKEVVESIGFDDHGKMIGDRFVGGNGGIVSRDTNIRADELRRAIHAVEQLRHTNDEASDGKSDHDPE